MICWHSGERVGIDSQLLLHQILTQTVCEETVYTVWGSEWQAAVRTTFYHQTSRLQQTHVSILDELGADYRLVGGQTPHSSPHSLLSASHRQTHKDETFLLWLRPVKSDRFLVNKLWWRSAGAAGRSDRETAQGFNLWTICFSRQTGSTIISDEQQTAKTWLIMSCFVSLKSLNYGRVSQSLTSYCKKYLQWTSELQRK